MRVRGMWAMAWVAINQRRQAGARTKSVMADTGNLGQGILGKDLV